MPRIHFFDGDKGGVGKSFCCRTLIQYFLDRNLPFVPVEADRYNPDVLNRYLTLGFQYAIFSDDEKQTSADELIEYAQEKPVIISLPSQVGKLLNLWLEDALEAAASHNIEFVRWFVTSGSYESVALFNESLKELGGSVNYVLVKNNGVGEDWSELEEFKGLKTLMVKHKVKTIEFPKLPFKERNLLDKNNLTFGESRNSALIKTVSRTRVEKFLAEAYSAFESTGLLP